MIHRPGLLLLSGFLVAVCASGQIILPGQQVPGQNTGGQYPGQYPGGGYPGQSPYPGRGRNTTQQQRNANQAPVITIDGMLRQASASSNGDIVIEADDKRIITIQLATGTRYFKDSGNNARLQDFQPGDQVSVDTTQDDNGYYHATRLTRVRQGTPEERAAASRSVDTSPVTSSDSDDDRPRLHRNTSSSADSTSSVQSSAPLPPPASPDPDDPGPPTLRRGVARPSTSSNLPTQVADNQTPQRPSIHAQDVNGVTRTPEPPKVDPNGAAGGAIGGRGRLASSGDPVIDMAREEAFSFSETLPNYVVKQFTTRYETEAAHAGQTSWRAIDTVTADVVSENGKESYKNILINGKPPKEAVEKTGSWSTGEYSSVQLDVLDPGTHTDFHNKRSTTIVSRAAFRYDFSVDQPNSHWNVYTGAESYKPEYTGSIWIDKDNYRVLRIELEARSMPRTFPLDTVESAVDYDYVMIGGNKFLLPVHSENLSCERGTSDCSRNVIDFRNYRKFGADTSITFDSPQ
jgi:hypothetical protein